MPPRVSQIAHPASGATLETPLLVPSFSSKGFNVVARSSGKSVYSEVAQYVGFAAPLLDKAYLVSAYDLEHKMFPPHTNSVKSRFAESLFAHPQILFVDSGLYERRIESDGEEPLQEMRLPAEWDETLYEAWAKRLAKQADNVALVSWDRPGESYGAQIAAAQRFFAPYRDSVLSVFLLKPEEVGGKLEPDPLVPEGTRLAAFNVIGVTEKELGRSVIERGVNIVKLRKILDDHGVTVPIHIFGALDPLYAPLYFACGAEIFDGLTWLRYAWIDGIAVHRDSWPILRRLNDESDEQRVQSAHWANLTAVRGLTRLLKRFVSEGEDWSIFGEGRAGVLQDAYLEVKSAL